MAELPVADGGWVLLAERPGEEIVLGLVGKFWRPVIEFADVARADFAAFAEPGYAKTIYDLRVRPLDDGRTLLSGLMRTATTDERARRWFRRYWTFGVGSGRARARLRAPRDGARGRGERRSGVLVDSISRRLEAGGAARELGRLAKRSDRRLEQLGLALDERGGLVERAARSLERLGLAAHRRPALLEEVEHGVERGCQLAGELAPQLALALDYAPQISSSWCCIGSTSCFGTSDRPASDAALDTTDSIRRCHSSSSSRGTEVSHREGAYSAGP